MTYPYPEQSRSRPQITPVTVSSAQLIRAELRVVAAPLGVVNSALFTPRRRPVLPSDGAFTHIVITSIVPTVGNAPTY